MIPFSPETKCHYFFLDSETRITAIDEEMLHKTFKWKGAQLL